MAIKFWYLDYVFHIDINTTEVFPWQKWFLREFIYCYIFALFTPLIVRFVKHYPIKRQRILPGLLIHISVSLLLSMVIKALHATTVSLINQYYSFGDNPLLVVTSVL